MSIAFECRETLELCDEGETLRCEGDTRVACDDLGRRYRVDCTEADQVCREFQRPSGLDAQCRPADAVHCEPSAPYCDGNTLVSCDSGTYIERRDECSSCLQSGGETLCLKGEELCDPSDPGPRCTATGIGWCLPAFPDDPDSPGYLRENACDAGDTCVDTSEGPKCLTSDTEPCDPATYDASCSGNTRTTCQPFGWVDDWDCTLDVNTGQPAPGFGCHEIDGEPTCLQLPYRPCNGDEPTCANGVGEVCEPGGWLRTQEACGGLNPVCRPHATKTWCTFADAAPCTSGSLDDIKRLTLHGRDVSVSPMRCDGSDVMIGCNLSNYEEIKVPCQTVACSDGAPETCQ